MRSWLVVTTLGLCVHWGCSDTAREFDNGGGQAGVAGEADAGEGGTTSTGGTLATAGDGNTGGSGVSGGGGPGAAGAAGAAGDGISGSAGASGCGDGFAGAGCEDVDECLLGKDDCAAAATCTNTTGSFECDCNPGFLGNGTTCSARPFASGFYSACAATEAGSIACWGRNRNGQLGTGAADTNPHETPEAIVGLTGVENLAVGGWHACAVLNGGQVQCWGWAFYGQVGDDTTGDANGNRLQPTTVANVSAVQISAGYHHTCAVLSTGGVKCWGNNADGQLGDGAQESKSLAPVAVSGLTSGVAAVATGQAHTCALMETGGVKCWGGSSQTPVDVVGLDKGVVQIAAGGGGSTCAVLSTGDVKCWGSLTGSQLPTVVSGLSGIVHAAVGSDHACFVSAAGGVKCWGGNGFGQLGDDSQNAAEMPVDVKNLSSGVSQVELGYNTSCALLANGAITCWGSNTYGQIGITIPRTGNTAFSKVPAPIAGFPVP